MSARQLIVLVVAAVAAIGALFLIRTMGGSRANSTAETAEAVIGEQVLVAARDVPQGAALTPSDLAVAQFPDGSVGPTFVRISQQPSAQSEFVGAVTRRAFVQGEPINTTYVIQPEGRGFMAAQLQPGFRAMSIEVETNTAAGGFIQPNDHVDVIMTVEETSNGEDVTRSEIVLRDIRVLAMNTNTQPQTTGEAPQSADANFAVLELSAEDARILAHADAMGDIQLALRGVQVETVGMGVTRNGDLGQSSGAVRIHAYGTVSGGGR